MSISVTSLHVLRLLLQMDTNLTQLQRDINQNAQQWLSAAQNQSQPLTMIQSAISSAVAQYNIRLGWITSLASDATNWPKVTTMLGILGGSLTEEQAYFTALKNAVAAIAVADISTYAAIVTGCNSLIASVPLPLSLWPE